MSSSSFQFRSMLVAAGVVASILNAKAQTYDFRGYIDTSSSAYFGINDIVDFKITLASPLTSDLASIYPKGYFGYKTDTVSLLIGGTEYINPSLPLPKLELITSYDAYSSNGIGNGWGGFFTGELSTFELFFGSRSENVIDSNGIVVGGVPISQLDAAGGYIIDDSFNPSIGVWTGEATWKVSSYSVLPSSTPVPEPATYGVIGAGLLGAIAFLRRRKP